MAVTGMGGRASGPSRVKVRSSIPAPDPTAASICFRSHQRLTLVLFGATVPQPGLLPTRVVRRAGISAGLFVAAAEKNQCPGVRGLPGRQGSMVHGHPRACRGRWPKMVTGRRAALFSKRGMTRLISKKWARPFKKRPNDFCDCRAPGCRAFLVATPGTKASMMGAARQASPFFLGQFARPF